MRQWQKDALAVIREARAHATRNSDTGLHVLWMTRVSPMSETFDPRPDYARDEHDLVEVFAQV